jgi:Protein of unknown function (DUF2795)
MTDVDEHRVRIALEGLRFPAGQHEVIAYVTDRGGVETDVLDAVEALPARAFTSSDDVVISIPEPARDEPRHTRT